MWLHTLHYRANTTLRRRFPHWVAPYDNINKINKYTEARQEFWNLIKSKSNNITIKQTSGDMIIMDNYRVLHGRAKYKDKENQRYFRQGYIDRDILQSRLKILK